MNRSIIILLITLCGFCYQIESLPSYWSAAQETTNNQAATPAIRQPLSSTEAPASRPNADDASGKVKKSEKIQIGVNVFIALVILWQAWIYNQQRKQTRIAERAYVGIKTSDFLDFEPGKAPIIEIVFLNGGRTPLWNLYTPGGFNLDTEPPDDWEPLKPPTDEAGAFLVAGATGTVQFPFPVVMNTATFNEIVSGRLNLYVKGTAWFEDCWGEKRSYPFYLVYNPQTKGFQRRKRYAEFMEYQTGKNAPIQRKRLS